MLDIIEPLQPDATNADGKRLSLQRQLTEQIKKVILSGRLPPGEGLASSRVLAKELGISRNTVVNSYDHLIAEGYIIADRQGTRVAEMSASLPRKSFQNPPRQRVTLAKRCKPLQDNPLPLSAEALLSPGMPAIKAFPLTSWRRSLERAAKQLRPASLGFDEPTGEPALKEAIARHLLVARGVRCDASRIVITEGAQQALELCVTLLTDPGDRVWMEDPGYRGARTAFDAGNLHTVLMDVDEEGICVSDDAWQATPPKLVYTSPAHQYPTGAVLSVSRRLALISKAREAGAWLIEDDYDGDFRHSGDPIASMQGLNEDTPVLYIGSYSKTLFPSLRLGFLVLPTGMMELAGPVLNHLLRNGQHLQQLALADFITSGEFGRHLGRMRRLYRERQRVLRHELNAHFDPQQILGGQSGMHLTLKLACGTDDKQVAHIARQQGLGVQALSTFSMKSTAANGLVIGYGNTSPQRIPSAVRLLVDVINAVQ